MIGKLKGRIDSTDEDSLIVDVGGVGYHVFASRRTLANYAEAGTAIELVIDTHVREDHIHLYGFTSKLERDWFRLLTTVQGVGVRMGMAILGMFAPEQIATIIAAQDKKQLTAVSGVGPKLAERIVTELKSKVGSFPTGSMVIDLPAKGKGAVAAASGVSDDAVSALVNLGYGRAEAYSAVARALQANDKATLDTLIKTGLKELAG